MISVNPVIESSAMMTKTKSKLPRMTQVRLVGAVVFGADDAGAVVWPKLVLTTIRAAASMKANRIRRSLLFGYRLIIDPQPRPTVILNRSEAAVKDLASIRAPLGMVKHRSRTSRILRSLRSLRMTGI